MNAQPSETAQQQKTVTINLDGEPLELLDRDTTPNEILLAANLDPATHYLVKLQGKHQESYQGRGEETVKVHNHERFISLSTGPTPTS